MNARNAQATRLERPMGFPIVAALLSLTAIGTVLFWSLLPTAEGTMPRLALYDVWKRSFPLAEAWMALSAVVAAIGLLRMRDWALLFGCLAGSALTFMGLTDVLFFLQNSLYTPLSMNAALEIVIHAWCLTFGPFVIAYLWGKREWLLP